jgi:hypothetical protein
MEDREMSVWFPNLFSASFLKFNFGCTHLYQFCRVLAVLSPNLTSSVIPGVVIVFDVYLLSSSLTLGIWCIKLHQE